eukprot:scaffold25756_cov16-Tisochrysis_lutea.AAC.1
MGVQVEVLRPGNGPKPQKGDKLQSTAGQAELCLLSPPASRTHACMLTCDSAWACKHRPPSRNFPESMKFHACVYWEEGKNKCASTYIWKHAYSRNTPHSWPGEQPWPWSLTLTTAINHCTCLLPAAVTAVSPSSSPAVWASDGPWVHAFLPGSSLLEAKSTPSTGPLLFCMLPVGPLLLKVRWMLTAHLMTLITLSRSSADGMKVSLRCVWARTPSSPALRIMPVSYVSPATYNCGQTLQYHEASGAENGSKTFQLLLSSVTHAPYPSESTRPDGAQEIAGLIPANSTLVFDVELLKIN